MRVNCFELTNNLPLIDAVYSLDLDDLDIFANLLKPDLPQSFGEDISELNIRADKIDSNSPILDA
jgi:hypothetical protein